MVRREMSQRIDPINLKMRTERERTGKRFSEKERHINLDHRISKELVPPFSTDLLPCHQGITNAIPPRLSLTIQLAPVLQRVSEGHFPGRLLFNPHTLDLPGLREDAGIPIPILLPFTPFQASIISKIDTRRIYLCRLLNRNG